MILLIDCDETLYPHSSGIMKDIGTLINRYMLEVLQHSQEYVTERRKYYIDTYGTTLNGLLRHEQVDPVDYCNYVHKIELDKYIMPNPELKGILNSIEHPKLLFTNAPKYHANHILELLNITSCFSGGFYTEDFNYDSKPKLDVFEFVDQEVKKRYPNETEIVLVDDYLRNLDTAKKVSWKTVWVGCEMPSGQYVNPLTSSQSRLHNYSEQEILNIVDTAISLINDLPIALECLQK